MELNELPGAWVLETFRRGGVDLEELTRRLPDDVELMLYQMDTIQPDSINRLLEACAEISGNPDFGLTINGLVDITMYGLFGYLLLHSSTVKDLFDTLVRYHSVHHRGGVYYQLTTDKQTACVEVYYDHPEYFQHRHTTEWALGFIPHFLKTPLGSLAQPQAAHFVYDAPRNLEKLQAYFGPNLMFNQPRNELIFSRSLLDQKITDNNPALLNILRKQADRHLTRHSKDHSLLKTINMILFENLDKHHANATDVAGAMNLSLSSFKRKLHEENIDFKKTKDCVRNELARELLLQTNVQLSEIALKTGFTNASSFTRFFIRCNQQKPLEYRKTRQVGHARRDELKC